MTKPSQTEFKTEESSNDVSRYTGHGASPGHFSGLRTEKETLCAQEVHIPCSQDNGFEEVSNNTKTQWGMAENRLLM